MRPLIVYWLDQHFPRLAVALRIALYRRRQAVEITAIDRYVVPGDYVLDIGARRGVFTVYLANRVGAEGRVDAFEPFPPNVTSLRRVINGRTQVRLLDVALSSEETDGELAVPVRSGVPLTAEGSLNNHHDGATVMRVPVRCRRLDDLLADRKGRVSFVKCDVEGHELEVLRGGRGVLDADRPVVLMEIEQRHCREDISSRFDFMADLGYEGYALSERHDRLPLAEFDVRIHQVSTDLGKSSGRYVNMFLFLPEGDMPVREPRGVAGRQTSVAGAGPTAPA